MKLKDKIIIVLIAATVMFQCCASQIVPVAANVDNATVKTQKNRAIGEGTTTYTTSVAIDVNNAEWGSVSSNKIELNQVLTGPYFDYSSITSNVRDEDRVITIIPNPGYTVKNVEFKTGILTGDISHLDLISWAGNSIIVKAPNLDKRTIVGRTYKIDVKVEFAPVSTTTFTRNVSMGGIVEPKDESLQFIDNTLSITANEDETTFVVIPNKGYLLDSLKVNGELVSVDLNGEFKIPNNQDALIEAEFIRDNIERPINFIIKGQGTVKLDGKLLSNGQHILDARESYEITCTPKNGYIIQSITLNNEPLNFTLDKNGEAIVTISPVVTKNIDEELKVVFAKKEIKLNKLEYTINYKEDAASKVEINEKLYQKLYLELVNSSQSIPVLPQTYDDTIIIKYLAGTFFGSKTWKELDYDPGFLSPNHKFGAKDTEIIRFEVNGLISEEITVNFVEIKKLQSQVILKDNLSIPYSKNAKALKNALYDKIDWQSSILPNDAKVDDFYYYYYCDVAILLNNLLGFKIPGIGDSYLVKVDADKVSTTEDLINQIPGLGELVNRYLSDEVKKQAVTPTVGQCKIEIKYKGNEDYKPSSFESLITITKAKAKLKVNSQTISYGQEIPDDLVTTDPDNINKIIIYAGIDATANGFVGIDLPNGALYDMIENSYKNGISLTDISKVLKALNVPIDSEILDKLIESLPDTVKDYKIKLGIRPENAGVYFVGAITIDSNYNTAYGTGLLTIAPQTTNINLQFINDLPSGNILTILEASNFNFGGIAVDDSGKQINIKPHTIYTGTSYDGKFYSDTKPIMTPGIYTETVYVTGNYLAKPITRVYTIDRNNANIKFNEPFEKVYDGQPLIPSANVYDSNGNIIDDADISNVYFKRTILGLYIPLLNAPVDAGEYRVVATYLGNGIYKGATNTQTYKINKATPIISADDITTTYDGKQHQPIVNINPANTDYSINYYNEIGNKLNTAPIDAGKYTFEINIKESDNYTSATMKGTIIINKATAVINVDDATKVYGSKDPQFTYKVEGMIQDDKLGEITLTREPGEDVGSYTINASVKEHKNYVVTINAGKLAVTKAQATIDVTNADKDGKITKTYDKKAAIPTVVLGPKFEVSVPEISDYTVTYYDNKNTKLDEAPINVGTYKYEIIVDDNKNYKGVVYHGEIVIKAYQVVINVDDATKVYGSKDPQFTYKVEGLIKDDKLGEITLSREAGEDVGSYTINARTEGNSNYEIKINTGKLTVTKAQATIDVTNADKDGKITKTYDKKAVIPTVVLGPKFEVSVPEISDYTVTYYDSRNRKLDEAPVNAGRYRYVVKVAATSNYNGAEKSGIIVINKALAEINVDDATKVYGSKDPQFTYKVEGLIKDDKLGAVSLSREAGEDVGSYTINARTEGNSNYEIKINAGKLTVTKAQATIDVTNADKDGKITKTYNKKAVIPTVVLGPEFEVSVPAVKEYSVIYYDEIGNRLDKAPVDAGSYTYAVMVDSTDNYNGAIKTGSIVIDKAKTVINVDDATKVYGSKDPQFTYKVEGLIKDDKLGEITLTREAGEDVGSYTINARTEGNSNYEIKINAGKLTVTKAQATIDVTNADKDGKITKTYDKKAVIPTVVLGPEFEVSVPAVKDYSVIYYDEIGNRLDKAPVDAGDYKFEVIIEETINYQGVKYIGNITIEQKLINVSVKNSTKIYGQEDPDYEFDLTDIDNEILSAEDLGIAFISTRIDEGEDVNQNGYQITVVPYANNLERLDNYKFEISEAVLTIIPRDLFVVVENQEKNLGDKDPKLAYSIEGLVFNDQAQKIITITREAGEEVGEYKIKATCNSANYTLIAIDGILTISELKKIPVDREPNNSINTDDNVNLQLLSVELIVTFTTIVTLLVTKKKKKIIK